MMYLRSRVLYWTPDRGQTKYATGHSKANWQLSKREPNNLVRGSREKPARVLTNQAVRHALGSGNRLKLGSKVRGFGNNGAYETYYLFNNVRSIMYLEEGSSVHAPMGIMRISIMETKNWLAAKGKTSLVGE